MTGQYMTYLAYEDLVRLQKGKEMTREDKYLLGCLFAIHQLQEKGSTEYAVKVDGEWETISWKEICDWIEEQYAIGEDEK